MASSATIPTYRPQGKRFFAYGSASERSAFAVGIRIDKGARAGVELETGSQAGERDPQLLNEFGDREPFVGCIDADLVKATGTEESPASS